jgi:hypothetical protein
MFQAQVSRLDNATINFKLTGMMSSKSGASYDQAV